MNDNDQPDDELLELVFEELDGPRSSAVRNAAEDDVERVAAAGRLARAVAAIRAESSRQVSGDFNDRLRRRLPEALGVLQADASHPTLLARLRTTGRWIMRSSVSRATAATILVLAMGGIAFWFHGGGTAPAFADFLQPILEARTLKYKSTAQWTSLSAEMKLLPAEMQARMLKGTSDEVMMLGADRIRTESVNPDNSRMVHIWDGRVGKSLSLLPDEKRATISDDAAPSEPKTAKPTRPDAAAMFRAMLLDACDKPGVQREPLGEREMDGRRVIGFRITLPSAVMTVWGDPKTGLPARIESTSQMLPNVKLTMADFEFNVELDESLFSTEPPAGYEVGSFFISTPVIDGSSTVEQDLIETFRQYSRLSGGALPGALDMETMTQIVYLEYSGSRLQKPGAREEIAQIQTRLQRGLWFSVLLPKEADAHYAGKGVSLGAADRPIFWYRPKNAKTYRVIYADLSIRDADRAPRPPAAQPEHDLIEMFRHYGKLSGGPFPLSLDLESLSQMVFIGSLESDSQKEWNPGAEKSQENMKTLMLKLRPGLGFIASLPADADSHYAGSGVSLGAADRPIFWYRPKNAAKYRVIYADLSVREADTPPAVPAAQPESHLVDMLRSYSELSGGLFPNSLDKESLSMAASTKLMLKYPPDQSQRPSAKHLRELMKFQMKSQPGLNFVASLPPSAGAQYAGRGVSLGTAGRPIFWYRPKNTKKYRVIYADLSIRQSDTPPDVPVAPPEEDLLDMFRHYGELSGGAFPDSLDKGALSPVLEKKVGLGKGQKPNAKQTKEIMEITLKFLPGESFIEHLPPEADAHYAGKGVSLGAADRPVFWYRPKNAEPYRVIYADLSVRQADSPPNVPAVRILPKDKKGPSGQPAPKK